MSFIKVTNNHGIQKGNPLYINTEWVVSVFEEQTPDGVKTLIFGGPTGVVWDVEESITEVNKKIEEVTRGKCSCN